MPDQNRGFERLILDNLTELKTSVADIKKQYDLLNEKNAEKFDAMKTELYKELTIIRIDIAQNKMKASVIGVISGAIPVGIMVAMKYFIKD